ncbi:MAG TPA: pilus assembly protein PilB, partial [Chthoniobacterales bacterium]
MNAQQVADIFIEQTVLQPSQAEDVLQEAKLNGKTAEQALIDCGFVDRRGFYQVIAEALATEFVELPAEEIPQEILRLIPAGLARLYRALPVALSDHTLDVALVDPLDLRAAEDLRFALGKDIHVVVAPAEEVEERINRYYGSDSSGMEDILKQLGETGELL